MTKAKTTSKNTKAQSKKTTAKKTAQKGTPAKKKGTAQKTTTKNTDNIVGVLFGWNARKAEGSHANLKEKLKPIGLDHLMPSLPTPEVRFRRAYEKVRKAFSLTPLKKAGSENGCAVFTPQKDKKLLNSQAKAAHERLSIETATLASIEVQKKTGELRTADENSPIFQAVKTKYEDLEGQFSSVEFHNLMKNLVHHFDGVPWLDRGVIYVLPYSTENQKKFEELKKIVRDIGNSNLKIKELRDKEDQEDAQDAFMHSLSIDWSKIITEAESFVSKALEGDLAHPTAFTAKLSQSEGLQSRIRLYDTILGEERDKLVTANTLVQEATELMIDTSVEVRALRKAKGSTAAQEMADKKLSEASKKANKLLEEARDKFAPVEIEEEEN